MIGSSRYKRRKWGWWLVLLERKHFKIKLLWFYRNGELSRQYHNHRAELWLFLRGAGDFYRGGDDDEYGHSYMQAGQVMLVPVMHIHKYIALLPTLVIEVQYGEWCNEKDIVRL